MHEQDRVFVSVSPFGTEKNVRRTFWLGGLVALAGCLSLLARPVVGRVVALHQLGQSVHPYLQWEHAGLLYVALPLVVLAGFLALLSPGILAAAILGRSRNLCEFVLQAFGCGAILLVSITTLAKLIFPLPLNSSVLMISLFVASAVAWLCLFVRARRGREIGWPLGERVDRRRLAWMLFAVWIGVVFLLPKLFWEDLNGDGGEFYFLSQSLFSCWTPMDRFTNPPSAIDAKWIFSMYVVHWMQVIFLPVEAAARLPLLFWLPVIFASVVALAEWKSKDRMGPAAEACLWLSLFTFGVTLAYNASYNPWFSDVAAPAAADIPLAALLLGALFFWWSGRLGWFALLAGLSFFVRPSAPLALVLLGAFTFWIEPEYRTRRRFVALAGTIAVAAGVAFLLNSRPASEGLYSAESLVKRVLYIRLNDFPRLAYLVFPTGILPALTFFVWRSQDRLCRVVTLTTVAYFGFFYMIAYVALHQFIPAMVLPLVVFWRVFLKAPEESRRKILFACAALGGLAFWLSLPAHFRLSNAEREVGVMLDFRTEGGDAVVQAMGHSQALAAFFPAVGYVRDPERLWGFEGSPIVFYATKTKPLGSVVNYVIQPESWPAPEGFTKVAVRRGDAAYVRDLQVWEAQKSPRMPARFQSPLYRIPQERLSPAVGLANDPGVIDLRKWLHRVSALLR